MTTEVKKDQTDVFSEMGLTMGNQGNKGSGDGDGGGDNGGGGGNGGGDNGGAGGERTAPVYNWSEKFGPDYDSEEKVLALKELPTRLQQIEAEKNQLAERLNTIDYADPQIATLNAFVKSTGIKDFGVYHQIMAIAEDPTKVDPIKLLALNDVLQDPTQIGNIAALEKYYEKTHALPADHTDEDIQYRDIKLNKLSTEARNRVSEIVSKIKPVSQDEIIRLNTEADNVLKTTWGEQVKAINIEKIGVPMVQKDGDKEKIVNFMDYEVPEADRKAMQTQALDIVIQNKIPATPENLQKITQVIEKRYAMENQAKILTAFAQKIRSMEQKDYDQLYHNPTPLQRKEAPAADASKIGDAPAGKHWSQVVGA